jgi:predicted phosphoribosyltransferase
MMRYLDRADAGRQLAALLENHRVELPLVLGLVPGGLPVAAEVAAALDAPLDALIVRKIGVPDHPDLALGAVAAGVRWLNEPVIAELGIPRPVVEQSVARETGELEREEVLYRPGRPPVEVAGRTVILVDDGLATGASGATGSRLLRQLGAGRVVFAAPVCSEEGAARVRGEADEVVCAASVPDFFAVSQAYHHCPRVTEEEVRQYLDLASLIKG